MNFRKSDRVALGFLVSALVGFGIFQAADLSYIGDHEGYKIWGFIYEAAKASHLGPGVLMFTCGLFFSAGIMVVSPFLIGVLSQSRIAWWTLLVSSAMTIVAVPGYLCWHFHVNSEPSESFGPGEIFMMIYPVLNFVGLLFIRGRGRVDGINGLDGCGTRAD